MNDTPNDTPINPANMDGEPLNQRNSQDAQSGLNSGMDGSTDSMGASAHMQNNQRNQGYPDQSDQSQDYLGQEPMGGPDTGAMTGQGYGGAADTAVRDDSTGMGRQQDRGLTDDNFALGDETHTGEGRGGVAGLGSYGGNLDSGPMQSSGTLDRQGANDATSGGLSSGALNETLMGENGTPQSASLDE